MNKHRINKCIVCGEKQFESYLTCTDHTVSQSTFELQSCNSCHFVFTQDIPLEENIGAYYEAKTYISHSDTKQGLISKLYHFGREWMLKRKKSLVESQIKSGKLLDVGAGTGYFLNTMKLAGWEVDGIEPSETARQIALQNFDLRLNNTLQLFDLEDDQYNVISLWHVLEHIYEPSKYLKKFNRLIKQGGILIIAVPNHNSFDARKYQSNWAAYDVPRHIWHFTPTTMKTLVEQHGFNLHKMARMPLDAFYVSMLSEKYKNGKNNIVRALYNGLRSNVISWINNEKCSSVIYVFQKE